MAKTWPLSKFRRPGGNFCLLVTINYRPREKGLALGFFELGMRIAVFDRKWH